MLNGVLSQVSAFDNSEVDKLQDVDGRSCNKMYLMALSFFDDTWGTLALLPHGCQSVH
jgi:hypothetical protein